MSVPARRQTASRGKTRRSGAKKPISRTLTTCVKCKSPVIPHRACSVCGTYKGNEVLTATLDKKTLKKQEKAKAQAN